MYLIGWLNEIIVKGGRSCRLGDFEIIFVGKMYFCFFCDGVFSRIIEFYVNIVEKFF